MGNYNHIFNRWIASFLLPRIQKIFSDGFWPGKGNLVIISECEAELSKQRGILVENNLPDITVPCSTEVEMFVLTRLQTILGSKAWLFHLLMLANYWSFLYSHLQNGLLIKCISQDNSSGLIYMFTTRFFI